MGTVVTGARQRKITLYIPNGGGEDCRALSEKIKVGESGHEVVFTGDLDELGNEWAAAGLDGSLFVLCPADRQELAAIQSLPSRSLNPALVFILPDNTRETLDAAYRSRPRFVFSRDDDITDINSVIKGMLQAKRAARA